MKPAACGITLVLFISMTAVAATTTPEINVALAVTPPGGIIKGSPLTLKATVSERRPLPEPRLILASLRYTFTAQRTWPCSAAAQVIAQNATNASVNWTPPVAGLYTFHVSVNYVTRLIPLLKTTPLAEANVGNYSVAAAGNFSHTVGFSISPSSGTAHAPATLSVGITLSNPGNHVFSYKFYLGGMCAGTYPNNCTINPVAAGSYLPQVEVREADMSACAWVATIATHDYNYYVVNP